MRGSHELHRSLPVGMQLGIQLGFRLLPFRGFNLQVELRATPYRVRLKARPCVRLNHGQITGILGCRSQSRIRFHLFQRRSGGNGRDRENRPLFGHFIAPRPTLIHRLSRFRNRALPGEVAAQHPACRLLRRLSRRCCIRSDAPAPFRRHLRRKRQPERHGNRRRHRAQPGHPRHPPHPGEPHQHPPRSGSRALLQQPRPGSGRERHARKLLAEFSLKHLGKRRRLRNESARLGGLFQQAFDGVPFRGAQKLRLAKGIGRQVWIVAVHGWISRFSGQSWRSFFSPVWRRKPTLPIPSWVTSAISR